MENIKIFYGKYFYFGIIENGFIKIKRKELNPYPSAIEEEIELMETTSNCEFNKPVNIDLINKRVFIENEYVARFVDNKNNHFIFSYIKI